jgi:hypothetical protein
MYKGVFCHCRDRCVARSALGMSVGVPAGDPHATCGVTMRHYCAIIIGFVVGCIAVFIALQEA